MNHDLTNQHYSGRKSKITVEIAAFVEAKLLDDDEIISVEVQRLILRNFSVNISAPTLHRYIQMMLVAVCTRLGPMM